jgi:hypothetical protein
MRVQGVRNLELFAQGGADKGVPPINADSKPLFSICVYLRLSAAKVVLDFFTSLLVIWCDRPRAHANIALIVNPL